MKLNLVVREPEDMSHHNGDTGEGGGDSSHLLERDIRSKTLETAPTSKSTSPLSISDHTRTVMNMKEGANVRNENHPKDSDNHYPNLDCPNPKTWHMPKMLATAILSEANNNVIHEKDEMRRSELSSRSPSSLQYPTTKGNGEHGEMEEERDGEGKSAAKSPYSLLPSSKRLITGKGGVSTRTPPPLIRDKLHDDDDEDEEGEEREKSTVNEEHQQHINPMYEERSPEPPVIHIPSNLLFSESAATLTSSEHDYLKGSHGDRIVNHHHNSRLGNVIVIAPEEPRSGSGLSGSFPSDNMCQDEPMDLSKPSGYVPTTMLRKPTQQDVHRNHNVDPESPQVLDLSRKSIIHRSVTEKLLLRAQGAQQAQTPPAPGSSSSQKVHRKQPKPRHSAPGKFTPGASATSSSGAAHSHSAQHTASPNTSRSNTPSAKKDVANPANSAAATDPGSGYWNPMWNPYMAAYSHYMNMAMLSGGAGKSQGTASGASSSSATLSALPGALPGSLPSSLPLSFSSPQGMSTSTPESAVGAIGAVGTQGPSQSHSPRNYVKEESMSGDDMDGESDGQEDTYTNGTPGMLSTPGGQPSSSTSPSRRKRGTIRTPGRWRTTYQDYQTKALEMEFLTNRFIPKIRRFQLAKAINLSERQIKIWFQNRRMKAKKEVQKVQGDHDFSATTGSTLLDDIRFTLGGSGGKVEESGSTSTAGQ